MSTLPQALDQHAMAAADLAALLADIRAFAIDPPSADRATQADELAA